MRAHRSQCPELRTSTLHNALCTRPSLYHGTKRLPAPPSPFRIVCEGLRSGCAHLRWFVIPPSLHRSSLWGRGRKKWRGRAEGRILCRVLVLR